MPILGGDYLKTAEVNDRDTIVFKNEGAWVESPKFTYDDGTPKQDFVIKVEWHEMDKSMRLNKTNRDILIEAYGNNTASWVGMSAIITKEKCLVAGKKLDTILLEVGETKQPKEIDISQRKYEPTSNKDFDNEQQQKDDYPF